MDELRKLLDRFWVTREGEPALYYALKRAQPDYQRFISGHLGWSLILNEAVVKLEKVPPQAMPWMGIAEFRDPLDYCILCAVLLCLADLDDGEQFLLSALTEKVEGYLAGTRPVDWTRFSDRKAMVRVLRYMQGTRMLLAYDGNSEGFAGDRSQEVLYENTGLSRHFPVHFGRDVLHCHSAEDFEALAREGAAADRGWRRSSRVYQQLALCPALYGSAEDHSAFDYVRNQYRWVSQYLGEALGGELQVYKNGAFLVFDGHDSCGMQFPDHLVWDDAALLLCAQLRQQVMDGVYPVGADDRVTISRRAFRQELLQCREAFREGLGRELRDLAPDRLCEEMIAYMAGWMLLEDCGETLLLCPAAGRWNGEFPAGWKKKQEGSNGPLENE